MLEEPTIGILTLQTGQGGPVGDWDRLWLGDLPRHTFKKITLLSVYVSQTSSAFPEFIAVAVSTEPLLRKGTECESQDLSRIVLS